MPVGNTRFAIALVTALPFLLLSSRAVAAEPTQPGKKLYLQYCSACHGADGRGDGVVSGFMRPKPTDLTQIAKQAGGQFPFAEMLKIIDGRQTVRAHGDPEMPVWGELFRTEEAESLSQQAIIRGKVMLITDHVQSLQKK